MSGYNFGSREDVAARSERTHSDEPAYDLSSIQITLTVIVFIALFITYLVMNG